MSAIDYDLARIKGIALDVDGVLSPSTIATDDKGQPMRMVNVKDGYALQLAVKRGLRIAIITGGRADAIEARYRSLGITDIYMGAAMKLPILRQWMQSHSLQPSEVAFMGDDIPDLQCMRYVGLSCTPHDGCNEARMTARYISRFTGGYGCVRDVLEQILKAREQWLDDDKAFGW